MIPLYLSLLSLIIVKRAFVCYTHCVRTTYVYGMRVMGREKYEANVDSYREQQKQRAKLNIYDIE